MIAFAEDQGGQEGLIRQGQIVTVFILLNSRSMIMEAGTLIFEAAGFNRVGR